MFEKEVLQILNDYKRLNTKTENMEKITRDLIDILKDCNSVEELNEAVIQKQKGLKDQLMHKGYNFDDEDEAISGGQRIFNEDVENYETYCELNFIRLGLTGRWIQDLDETERYEEIENEVTDIIHNI